MKRVLLTLTLVLIVGASRAAADYLIIKIDVNNITTNIPSGGNQPGPGQMLGMMGGGPQPGQQLGIMGGGPQPGQQQGFMGGGPKPGAQQAGLIGGGTQPGFMGGQPGAQLGNLGGQPQAPPFGGQAGAMGASGAFPGPMGQMGMMIPGFGGNKGAAAKPEPEQPPLWVSAYLEIKTKPKILDARGSFVEIETKFGKKNVIPIHPMFKFMFITKENIAKDFEKKFKKEKEGKDRDAGRIVQLAVWAWTHGLIKEFHGCMKELKEIDPKHRVVAAYTHINDKILKPALNVDDPAVKPLLDDLASENYRMVKSEQGHYGMLSNLPPAPANDLELKRRLARLEESYESFFLWFALQDNVAIPPAPKHRLLAVLVNNPQEFHSKHAVWGSLPMAGDGFTPRRDNVIVLSARRLDEAYAALAKNNQMLLTNMRVGRDDLLSGKIWERPEVMQMGGPVAIAQTLNLVQKAMEEEGERTTTSHEATRQLLAATGILPRNVIVPEWITSGLASYFETPYNSLYGSGGMPSWSHLISFKHHRKTGLGKSRDVLQKVLSDTYFTQAQQLTEAAHLNKDKDQLADKARLEWERARATSWALVYYLVQNREFNKLVRYTQELNTLPRDLDLDQRALEGVFAKSFELGDAKNALKLDAGRLQTFADAWFAELERTSLAVDQVEFEALKDRAAPPKKKLPPTPPTNPALGGFGPPNIAPM